MALLAKLKKGELKSKLLSLLSFIVAETQGPNGKGAAPVDAVNDLKKYEPELIEVLGEPNPAGMVFVKATETGIAAVKGVGAVSDAPAVATSEPKQTFVLETGFVPPPTKRGGIRESSYPFATMAIGQSFLVAATDAKPLAKLAKSMASTVSGVNKRYATTYPAKSSKAGQPTGKDGRKFTVRARMVGDGEKVDGVRVYRIN